MLALGADAGINYKTQDFVAEVKALTDGRGVDVILDMVAGNYIDRDIKVLADDGRIVMIALLGGAKTTVNADQILRRWLTITGSMLHPRDVNIKAAIARALREKVWPLFSARKLKPVVYATFSLEQAAQAHAMMESGQHIGKIVLAI